MHFFVTGGTGLIGRALIQSLLGQGHEVTAWVRDVHRARQRLGSRVQLCAIAGSEAELARRLNRVEVVVNLAGESVLGGAWTEQRKRALRDSRVRLTQQLMAACRAAERPPSVVISGSAVGYYGESADVIREEDSPAGAGFLAELCVEWERAATEARAWGARVVLLRIGIVLSPDGGALAAMLPAFAFGLGGPLGSGKQYMPWIHRDDLVGIIVQAASDARMTGPINCAAPEPVTSRVFARALGQVLGRPAVLRVPAFALRLVLGERATVALQSQRAVPRALERWSFAFRYASLDAALRQCVGRNAGVSIRRATRADQIPVKRKPAYVL
ncbi:MAG TPA: TIGR01777 family oxidoreductase, partial [Polyangiales bacterium]|nr:TIGR01777 family oxidoreductase [Polyangiales bacterium]